MQKIKFIVTLEVNGDHHEEKTVFAKKSVKFSKNGNGINVDGQDKSLPKNQRAVIIERKD